MVTLMASPPATMSNAVERLGQRQAVGDQVGDRHRAVGDEPQGLPRCAPGLDPLAPTMVSSR